MRRRQALALGGSALLGTAGCLGDAQSDAQPSTTATVSSVEVTVNTVQRGIVKYTTPDSIGVLDSDRRHVLFGINATNRDDPPAADAFALRFDGREYDATTEQQGHQLYQFEGSFYTAESGVGHTLFDLPTTGTADDAALVWDGDEWPLPESIRRRLEVAPEFAVSFDDELTNGSCTLTVTNEGDRPQRFLAAVNQEGGSSAYRPIGVRTAVIDGGANREFDIVAPANSNDSGGTPIPGGRRIVTWAGGKGSCER